MNNQTIAVCSFNIRYDNDEDGMNSWKYRRDFAARLMLFHDFDIIGLQEVLSHQFVDLKERMPEYTFVGIGREDGKEGGEYCAIAFKKTRFQMMDEGHFWLSETPEKIGSIGWDAACIRMASWVKLKDTWTNKELFFLNVHVDHEGKIAMEESVKLILRKVHEISKNLPVVITGDFNFISESKPYKILTDNSEIGAVKDAMVVSLTGHYGSTATFHNFKAIEYLYQIQNGIVDDEIKECFSKIDYIFVKNNIKVLKHGVLADQVNGAFPSDHFPVVAQIDWSVKSKLF